MTEEFIPVQRKMVLPDGITLIESESGAGIATSAAGTGLKVNTSLHIPSGTLVIGAPIPESLYWNYTYPGNTYVTMDKATSDNDASLVFTQAGRAKWEFGATTEGPGTDPARIHMKVVRNPTANPADDQFLDVMIWDYVTGDTYIQNGYKLGVGTIPSELFHVAGLNVSAARVISKFENYNTGAGSQSACHVFQGIGTSWATGNDFGLNAGHNYFIQDGNSGGLRYFANANGVSIGGSTVEPTEALRVESTTGGFLYPRLTTAQRDAMGSKNAGLTIYNSTTTQIELWNGAAWVSSGAGSVTSVAVADATGITWTGSPITTSGTLTPTLSVNLQAWSGTATASKLDTSAYTAADVLAKLVTVDGTGSGLDADLLDGINSTQFARLDAIPVFAGGASGAEGGEIRLVKPVSGTTFVSDLAFDVAGDVIRWYDGGGTNRGFYLDISAGAAGAASKIWHSGNDGTGSGLDADLLDGINSTQFARLDAVPIFTGGASGAEGGEIRLVKPVSGTTFVSDLVFDVAGDVIRFYDGGGTNRGFYLDISTAAAGVASKIWHSGNLPEVTTQLVVSNATLTPTFDNRLAAATALAVNVTIANPTGTAVDGWRFAIRLKDDGTGRTISYGAQYRAMGVTLPTTTVATKTTYLFGIWNATDSKVDVYDIKQEA